MKLAQVQSALFSLVVQDGRTWLRPDALVSGGSLDAAERVHIYAEMYRLRTRDALREDFPHTAELLGAKFDATVDRYVDELASLHPSLHRLGRSFAAFLHGEAGRADLPDVAALEWARSEAFVAEDSPVATQAEIATVGPERLPEAKLVLTQSVRLLELQHDADRVWRAMEAHQKTPAARKLEQRLVVWRKGEQVFHVTIDADELEALRRAESGATVAVVCEAFAGRADPARAAFTALGSWLSEEMIARFA